jgi:hypothetical protein
MVGTTPLPPLSLDRPAARRLAAAVGAARIVLGAVAVLAPNAPLRPWVGDSADDHRALLLARALGGRDLALGLGVLLAIREGGPVRGWVEAGGLADTGDALFTLLAWRRLPAGGRWLVASAAAGAALAAVWAAPALDGEPDR